jgi:hypothetical protein
MARPREGVVDLSTQQRSGATRRATGDHLAINGRPVPWNRGTFRCVDRGNRPV